MQLYEAIEVSLACSMDGGFIAGGLPSVVGWLPSGSAGDAAHFYGRLWASRHYRLLGGEDHFAVWTDLGQRVRARHNRLHPFTPISQVGLQHVSWPRSREGFYAMRQTNLSQYTFWLVATNR